MYWRFLTGPSQAGGVRRQLDIKLLVLDPPAPLASPLVLQISWYHVETPLPAARTYALGPNLPAGVTFGINSNLGTWFTSQGQVRLGEVTDSSLKGSVTATLVPVYPPGSRLPNVMVDASFLAPHVGDGSVGN